MSRFREIDEIDELEERERIETPEQREAFFEVFNSRFTTPEQREKIVESVTSETEYLDSLRRNPQVRLERFFDREDALARFYFKFKSGLIDSECYAVIAEDCEVSVSRQTIGNWDKGMEPRIVPRLRRHSVNCTKKYSPLQEAEGEKITRISGTIITEVHSPFEKHEEKWETIATSLVEKIEMAQLKKSRVISVNLQNVSDIVSDNLRNIEQTVRKQINNESMKVGFVDGTLYIWNPDTNPLELINAYQDSYFYFHDKNELAGYIAGIKEALTGTSNRGLFSTIEFLNELLSQMFPEHCEGQFIDIKRVKLKGAHLHLLNDISGRLLKDFEGRILKITGRNGQNGIENPKFMEGKELRGSLAKTIAVVISDGFLGPCGRIYYSEPELKRIRIVENNLRAFGDIDLNYWSDPRANCFTTSFPTVLGNALLHVGLCAGNKTLSNPELPIWLIEEEWEILCSFFGELIPQDGTVTLSRISWTHSCALHPGKEIQEYPEAAIISDAEIELIQQEGTRGKKYISLNLSYLELLTKSETTETASLATRLMINVFQNPNNFVMAEKQMAEKLGIKIEVDPYLIKYHYKTRRVSVAWDARTAGINEMIRMAIIAPSNDINKREIVRESILQNQDLVQQVLKKLDEEERQIAKWWII